MFHRNLYSPIIAVLVIAIISITGVSADDGAANPDLLDDKTGSRLTDLSPKSTRPATLQTLTNDSQANLLTATILDDFNRANGPIGSNWSGNTADYAIASNQLNVGTDEDIYWNVSKFGVNQAVAITLTTINPSTSELGLTLKAQSNSRLASGLLVVVYRSFYKDVQVWTYSTMQGWRQRGTNIQVNFSDGDQFGAQAMSDGQVGVFKNGTLIAIRDVTAWPYYADDGYIGLFNYDASNIVLDDFSGGTENDPLTFCTDPLTCNPVTSIPSYWRCNLFTCVSDWTGSVINWPFYTAYETNARSLDQSRTVYSFSGDEVLYAYMHDWATGCEVTAVAGESLVIEWERGTNVWSQTLLEPGESHTINLVSPEDGALIEGGRDPITISLSNCPLPTAPLIMGRTIVPPNTAPTSSGNADILIAQQTTLAQSGILQNINIYVDALAGQIRLGIYEDNAGSPGALLAETAVFDAAPGWNEQITTSTPTLEAGTYWLAFLSDDNNLEVGVEAGTGISRNINYTFAALPNTFPGSSTNETANYSLYATLVEDPTTLSLTSFGAQQTSLLIVIASVIMFLGITTTIIMFKYSTSIHRKNDFCK